ncbi:sigma 54-interacting transcriptional regulator [Clostridium sp. CM028]|uniref:sigma 54-interacting transcriptional regulator n=1 Tax=unclassified Clostridium TaxID=2614128 RepID=UPI001C6DDE4E|nr:MULTISPECIES: sigma 54-interacting transcriptional regulator [unclassified Clostridium]MBW9145409.1 sigma 54-interacting transcriptional regulator [Clostridium sp. CM027]MBW9148773.1 sigma 54-interacting transcriptional regulator [Clostridium sp. CM028]UVE42546.1 sigma 54-interacting transcriptional regulator [Clostridium sp. CM027]WLC63122.1 sigma 54-interacting transcriptional regulator [Clostridium sp. CM028]
MIRGISLVAGSESTKIALLKQLEEYIDIKYVKSYAIENNKIHDIIENDLVILSGEIVKRELIEKGLLNTKCDIIIAKRTINYDHIDEIFLIPENTEVLLVNDLKESTYETIEIFKELGIDHIKCAPYYPGILEINERIKIAITPGETDKIPGFIEKKYDIGPRIMDPTTIIKILVKLDLLEKKSFVFSQNYLFKIISIAEKLGKYNNKIIKMNSHLNYVIDGLHQGLIVYDKNGIINVLNEDLKCSLKINSNKLVGKRLKNVVYNKKLLEYLMDNTEFGEKGFNLEGIDISVNKFQIDDNDYTVAVFKKYYDTTNDNKEKNLITKGLVAKYSFDDIISDNSNMQKTKNIARKLAKTDLTILIEGENGTGKELFASALHKSSRRRKEPFLAVNCSSLPDELIESELFGYEDGAFTGAKKGGKPGLFEQANGGTIFLDEIGDISLKVQIRLLRVLQEKEVMRIGGNGIIPVDVNIIVATNRDLFKMIEEGQFRKDLYYRLKIGYLKIPPLRDRKEDIEPLLKCFLNMESRQEIKIECDVIEILKKYDWYGNVRELRNTINYMLAIRDSDTITLNELPDISFFQNYDTKINESSCLTIDYLDRELKYILMQVHKLSNERIIVGRKIISEESKKNNFNMSESMVRTRLERLERKGLIVKGKGKKGTCLTELGEKVVLQK